MSNPMPPSIAESFCSLVTWVSNHSYEHASLTLVQDAGVWEIGMDTGPEVEDLVEWRGTDLEALLAAAVDSVAAPRSPAADECLSWWERFQRCLELSEGGSIDLAFVPRSDVEPSRPWEAQWWTETSPPIISAGGTAEAALTELAALLQARAEAEELPRDAPRPE